MFSKTTVGAIAALVPLLGVGAMVTAATASADFGIGGSVNGQTTQVGDVDVASSEGNAAFAVNLPGFDTATARADGQGTGNLAVSSLGSEARVINGNKNVVIASHESVARVNNGDRNAVLAVHGSSGRVTGQGSNNVIISAFDSDVQLNGQASSNVAVGCGGGMIISAQSDSIETSGACAPAS